jgi:Tol biopolymer transport system component/DNA-binding winged helix-turn-helix (wHTH) protein
MTSAGGNMQGDFQIGDRLIQPKINSIQFEGETIRLEPKVMQVLLVLASNPGEVCTREDIRGIVWRDVFVGDEVLMRAVSEIRRIFNDDARTPRIIQTVPKVGYRLIASVSQLPSGTGNTIATATLDEPPMAVAIPPVELPPSTIQEIENAHASHVARRWIWWLAAGAAAILLAFLGSRYLRRPVAPAASMDYVSHPLTTYPGSQVQPALSPEGDAVAFIWSKGPDEVGHLFVKAVNSGAPMRVTSGPGQDFSPAWSPNGRELALIRRSGSESAVEVVSVVGGSERRVYTLPNNKVFEYGGLTWTPDGDHLIFPQETTLGGSSQLVELTLSTHAVQTLTTPPSHWSGDWMPAVSPDGSSLAFVRGAEQSTRDIYLMKLPGGAPRKLTSDARLILGLTWTADGTRIVFASNRGGSFGLWRVAGSGAAPERELAGTDGAYWPTVARKGGLLAYTHGNASWSIVSIPLDSGRQPVETEVLTSSEQDASPQVSPEGDRLAFQSWRSGGQEVWVSAIDGSNPIQLTNGGASAGSPSWSRDGKLIAFDARPQGFPHIYVTDADGASPREVTSGAFTDIVPSWSADNQWIYFGSNRSADWQIWRIAASGHGAPEQVTQSGGMIAKLSMDGKWIYYTKSAAPGVWRRAVEGGTERRVADGPALGEQNYWALAGNELYVLSSTPAGRSLLRVDPETGKSAQIYTLKHDPTPFTALTVTPDGKHLIFAELMEAQSNITLVEHYR